jgi:two-component system, chemotaxis family, chemotaxis protein CheY
MRALVIDDSRTMRVVLRRILQGCQFEVFEAADGLEALDVLREVGQAELALVDYNMPRMDGLEFIRAVRRDGTHKGLCLMMVTSESEVDKVASALAAGAHEYVMKPFTSDIIVEKLGLLGLLSA